MKVQWRQVFARARIRHLQGRRSRPRKQGGYPPKRRRVLMKPLSVEFRNRALQHPFLSIRSRIFKVRKFEGLTVFQSSTEASQRVAHTVHAAIGTDIVQAPRNNSVHVSLKRVYRREVPYVYVPHSARFVIPTAQWPRFFSFSFSLLVYSEP